MSQTRRNSLLESSIRSSFGIPTGFIVSFCVGFIGLDPFEQAFVITSLMFLVSTIVGYVVRRKFEKRMIREQAIDALHDAAQYDRLEPLSSHNWEPPAFKRAPIYPSEWVDGNDPQR